MQALEQTLSMPATEFYGTAMEDIYNYDGSSYPDPSAFGLQFDNTVDTMYDPSTGGMWQPMDNSESSIDPSLLKMSDRSLDISSYAFTNEDVIFRSQSLDYFDPNSYAPFSPEIPAAVPKLSAFAAAEYHLSREAVNLKRREPTKPVIKGSRPRKTYQSPVNSAGCWCTLCTGPAPKVNAFDLEILTRSKGERKAVRKQNAKRHQDSKKAASGQLKRKARELTPELASTLDQVFGDFDDEKSEGESEEQVSEDGEYRPAKKLVKTTSAKRRRVTRQEAKDEGKKMPNGLEIDMNGW
ncbi:MAG: hypothetical protein L6R38_000502 [Xanthoria sp. 2 TBL-2021]|nr:MAG: hypothetical protein L6R38_000502 [Xanthoria sp. 2 TBL-2021]